MKLHDIKNVNEAYEEDYATDMKKRLEDRHFEMAYNVIAKKEYDREEIKDLAKEFAESEQYDRTANSAEFVLNRMHILVHGIAPHGETESRAETMFRIPDSMIKFANNKGIDTFENIKSAKVDLANRPKRVNYETAKNEMAKYWKEHKDWLSPKVKQHREDIIQDIMAGSSPEDAFEKYM